MVAPAADLQLAKSADSLTPAPGGNVTFGLELVNNGPTDAQAVEVTDTLPAGLTFVSASPGCSASGQTVTCAQASLTAGAAVVFQITAQVAAGTAGADLTNAAEATSGTPDPIDANNRDVTTVSPGAPPFGDPPDETPPAAQPPEAQQPGPSADLVVSKRALNRRCWDGGFATRSPSRTGVRRARAA